MNKEENNKEKPRKKLLFKLNPAPKKEEIKIEIKKPEKSIGQILLENARKEIREEEIIRAQNILIYKERGKAKRKSNIGKKKESDKSECYSKTEEYRKEYYSKNKDKYAVRSKKRMDKKREEGGKYGKYKRLFNF